jgi:putative ABC transport system substrate-binding protein
MMNRRMLVIGLCTAALVPLRARAQTTGSVYRVGVLSPARTPTLDRLIAALGERGWVVGRNLVVDMRYTQGDPQRAEGLARELVEQRVNVIVTNFTATAMAAHRATSVTPIVMATSGFPVEGGLANSLARPGGNVTGMTVYAGGGALFGKFVELLRELVPSLRELGVFWGYAPPSYKPEQVAPATRELHRAASALDVNVRFWQTGTESDLASAVAAASNRPLDALFATGGVIHARPEIAATIGRFVLQRRLPTLSDGSGPLFAAAAVSAYTAEPKELAARTAHFIDRILKGARPGDLPIEQPTKYELVINRKMAKSIGLTIPPSLLLRADRIVE